MMELTFVDSHFSFLPLRAQTRMLQGPGRVSFAISSRRAFVSYCRRCAQGEAAQTEVGKANCLRNTDRSFLNSLILFLLFQYRLSDVGRFGLK
jgi:hypothetical protein